MSKNKAMTCLFEKDMSLFHGRTTIYGLYVKTENYGINSVVT